MVDFDSLNKTQVLMPTRLIALFERIRALCDTIKFDSISEGLAGAPGGHIVTVDELAELILEELNACTRSYPLHAPSKNTSLHVE